MHVLLFLVFSEQRLPPLPYAAAGPRAGDAVAAPGSADGGLEVVALAPTTPQPVVPPPEPLPIPEVTMEVAPEPEPEIAPPELDATQLDRLQALAGTGNTATEAAGLEGATGRGNAGTAAEGRRRVTPPTPRGLILPPADRPGDVRGREVGVWVFVTRTGTVVPDSTRLEPPTGDGDFDERLRQQAAEWVFEPARRGGEAVAEWFRYVIVL